jgi:hypothetical protein
MVHEALRKRISMDELARLIYVDNPKMVDYMRAHEREEGFSLFFFFFFFFFFFVIIPVGLT